MKHQTRSLKISHEENPIIISWVNNYSSQIKRKIMLEITNKQIMWGGNSLEKQFNKEGWLIDKLNW